MPGWSLPYFSTDSGIDSRDTELKINQMRLQIGMVFQGFNLWPHKTALENVIEAPIYVKGIQREVAVAKSLALIGRVGLLD